MPNFLALYWPPRLEKGDHQIWGTNLQTLRPMFQHLLIYPGINVPALNNKLRPNNKPKMLKVGPKFFQPWLIVWSRPKISHWCIPFHIGTIGVLLYIDYFHTSLVLVLLGPRLILPGNGVGVNLVQENVFFSNFFGPQKV
jgi:hypothetical protein